jgi:hypothetical protein
LKSLKLFPISVGHAHTGSTVIGGLGSRRGEWVELGGEVMTLVIEGVLEGVAAVVGAAVSPSAGRFLYADLIRGKVANPQRAFIAYG